MNEEDPLAPLSDYYTISKYEMSSGGVTQTLYQPHQFYQQRNKLGPINEIARVISNHSMSSDIYLEPHHDYKVELKFTAEEIELVRSTWKEMISDDLRTEKSASIASSLFCIQFYSNLLSMDNDLEKLFPSIKHQAV